MNPNTAINPDSQRSQTGGKGRAEPLPADKPLPSAAISRPITPGSSFWSGPVIGHLHATDCG